MKISTKVHGIIDYVLVLVLWFAPTLFGFEQVGGPAEFIPRAAAVMLLVVSLLTKHELGVVKIIPMRVHLMLDIGLSLILAASPFIFDFYTFDANVWMPHIVAGIGYLIISLMTEKESTERSAMAHR